MYKNNKTNDQIIDLLEKLFDAKLKPLDDSLKEIKKSLYGDEKNGLIERVEVVEQKQGYLVQRLAGLSIIFGIVFTTIAEFFRDYIKKRLGF